MPEVMEDDPQLEVGCLLMIEHTNKSSNTPIIALGN
jgi:hypothetical protein